VNKATQGSVHSAFYNGYTLTQARALAARLLPARTCLVLADSRVAARAAQIPGGWAASRYGGERVLSTSFVLWSAASLLTPSDGARTGALYAARVLVGSAMGVVFPSIHSILVTWIPPHERSRAVSLFTSGMYFGSAFGMLALPALIAARGPGAVPLAVGAAGFMWLGLWSRFATRRPGGNAAPARCVRRAGGCVVRGGALTRLLRAAPGCCREPFRRGSPWTFPGCVTQIQTRLSPSLL
jgi:MFS family permease